MKSYIDGFVFFLLLFTLLACEQSPTSKTFTGDLALDIEKDTLYPSSARLPEPDILERLKFQKRRIDTLLANDKLQKELWLIAEGTKQIIRLQRQDLLDTCTNTTFILFRDNSGKVLCAREVPYIQSGDGLISYTHYFDSEGKTFAFERYITYLSSSYKDDYLSENIIELYNQDFNKIHRDKTLNIEKGEHPWNYSYEVAPTFEVYWERIKITEHKD
ncbi:hypothetical protein [Lishizhenia sp.]|uniref:hypothetical protein n=1 Tax=Lishizhenia sp. TaxID=2497594 RepID=UPI00299F15E6|nr:hypothetical protein [Lishizhenia sp.]MDX1447116.1 hypothetical protein [Lishizhenia sp.]